MSERYCLQSCAHAEDTRVRDSQGPSVLCGLDGQWRTEGSVCHQTGVAASGGIVGDGAQLHDVVNHPLHYTQGGVECIDAIEAAVTGLYGPEAVLTGQVIKYVWRWPHKNGAEDLRKAKWYLSRLIDRVEAIETAAETGDPLD